MIGTLLRKAAEGGFDFAPWKTTALTPQIPTVGKSGPFGTGQPTRFFTPANTQSSGLKRTPWLAPGMLLRGDVTILAGQGGSAKTAFAIAVAVAMAAGRTRAGPFTFKARLDGLNLRVGYLSAEEGLNSLNLLVAAASSLLGLDATERAAVEQNFFLHDARVSGWRVGPEPDMTTLRSVLASEQYDLLIVDTAASMFALENENDNGAVTRILATIGQMAVAHDVAVMALHHTPKMTKENVAAQRGEVTMVRGGGAYVNAARIVLTITHIPAAEAGAFLVSGHKVENSRRIDHAKINDCPPMQPSYFEITEAQVQLNDGTDQAVRGIRFIAPPTPASAGGASAALRNVVMRAIDAGTRDQHGAKVPLSPPGSGGKNNTRDALGHVSRALIAADPALSNAHAEALARDIIADLRDRVGCVIERSSVIPKYKANGSRNGTRDVTGLAADWSLAPWAVPPAPPSAPVPPPDGALVNPGATPATADEPEATTNAP